MLILGLLQAPLIAPGIMPTIRLGCRVLVMAWRSYHESCTLSWVMKPTSSGWVDRICSVLDANDLDRLWYLGMRKHTWNENYTRKCEIKKGKRQLHKNITSVVWRSVDGWTDLWLSHKGKSYVSVKILMLNFIRKQGYSL